MPDPGSATPMLFKSSGCSARPHQQAGRLSRPSCPSGPGPRRCAQRSPRGAVRTATPMKSWRTVGVDALCHARRVRLRHSLLNLTPAARRTTGGRTAQSGHNAQRWCRSASL